MRADFPVADRADRSAFIPRRNTDAVYDKIAASMELKLHGVPRDREARKRLEVVLGPISPVKADNGEDGRYDPLRWGL